MTNRPTWWTVTLGRPNREITLTVDVEAETERDARAKARDIARSEGHSTIVTECRRIIQK